MGSLFGGGGGSTSTKFNAGSIPQSLYDLGGAMTYFRQNDLEPLESSPVNLINWALGQAGVPVQQTTGAGGYIQAASGGAATGVGGGTQQPPLSQTQLTNTPIPTNPWAGKSPGSYGDPTSWYNWVTANRGKYVYINGQPVQITGDQANMTELSKAQAAGTLSLTGSALQQSQGIWNQLQTAGTNLMGGGSAELQKGITDLNQVPGYSTILGAGTPFFSQAQPDFAQAQSMFQTAAPLVQGNLTPQQQALIDQATQAEKAGITQQLASEGLESSTMLQEKLGGAEQQGAATAGGLIQGNIQLGEGEQQQAIAEQGVGLSEQGMGMSAIQQANAAANTQLQLGQTESNLGLNMQTTGANWLQTVSVAGLQAQQQFYNEAMAGYGVLGNMLSQQLQTFGLQLQGEQIKVGASGTANQIAASANAQQQAADAQGFSGFLSGIGSLLGGKGGLGGGIGSLIGGASSLFGGGTAAAGGAVGAGAAAGGSLAGIGSAVGSALTALSAAFCQAGREIFGDTNPEWMLLRDLMLFRAPRWLRRWYIRNAATISRFLHKKEITKWIVRTILRAIMG